MNIEDLKKEYYQVMEYTQPFGNEHHEELFKWMINKMKDVGWMAYHQCMIDNLTTGYDDIDRRLPTLEEDVDKVTYDKWFTQTFGTDRQT